MERIKTFCASLATLTFIGVQGLQAQTVDYVSDGKSFRINSQVTQSEMKAGWRVMDIQMKSTVVRYLWGARSKQLVDSNHPQFAIDTDTLLLSDMVLIKLKKKKEYRRIPESEVKENRYTVVDFNNFDIKPYGEDGFLIRPTASLSPGEYIFTWTTGQRIGELKDWIVWPFSVE